MFLSLVMLVSLLLVLPGVAAAGSPPFAVLNTALYAPSPQSEGHFGASVAVSGDTIVVGEPGRNVVMTGASGVGVGAVDVYVKSGGVWVFQQELRPSPLEIETGYGTSVDIDGDRLIVGAPTFSTAGAAFIYKRSGTTWTLEKSLAGSAADGRFGSAVAIDAGTAAIGAPMHDSGSIDVWRWTGLDWVSQATLVYSGGSPGDQFGGSIALEGDTLVAGATNDDYGFTSVISNAGSAHWFTRSGNTWTWRQMIVPPDPIADGWFGGPISISDSRILVGSWNRSVGGVSGAGAAYMFVNDGVDWGYERTFTAPVPTANDYYGSGVALDGRTALIGAFFANSYHGNAYFYTYETGVWTHRQKLDLSADTPSVTQLGTSAALSGGTAVLGAQMSDAPLQSIAGSALVFDTRGTLSGVVRDAVTGLPVSGIEISAYVGDQSGDPDLIALTNTDALGRYSLSLDTDDYAIGYMDGSATYYAGFYNEVHLWPDATKVSVIATDTTTLDLNVHPKPKVSLTKVVAPSSVGRNRRFTAYGFLKPRHRAGSYPVKLQLYRYVRQRNGLYAWTLYRSVSARAYDYRPTRRASWYTKYRATISLPYNGKWKIRAYHAADATYGPSYSSWRYITAR
ncbi:MAG: hypothetical protein Q7W16_09410 [Coriobacteriia bacterium]|nr:hypothetical protein [Coriobacteriia bacterium]